MKVLFLLLHLVMNLSLAHEIHLDQVSCYPFKVLSEQREKVFNLMKEFGTKSSEPSIWASEALMRLDSLSSQYVGQEVGQLVLESSKPILVKIKNRYQIMFNGEVMGIYYEDICREENIEFFSFEKCEANTLYDLEKCEFLDEIESIKLVESHQEEIWKRY